MSNNNPGTNFTDRPNLDKLVADRPSPLAQYRNPLEYTEEILKFEFRPDDTHPFDLALAERDKTGKFDLPLGPEHFETLDFRCMAQLARLLAPFVPTVNSEQGHPGYRTFAGLFRRFYELGWVVRKGMDVPLLCLPGTNIITRMVSVGAHGPSRSTDREYLDALGRCSDPDKILVRIKEESAWLWHAELHKASLSISGESIRKPHSDPEIRKQVDFFFKKPEPYIPLWKRPKF